MLVADCPALWLQNNASQHTPAFKVQPMKAQQYRSLAKSAQRVASAVPGPQKLLLPLNGSPVAGRSAVPPVSPQAPKKHARGEGACWRCFTATEATPREAPCLIYTCLQFAASFWKA